MPSMSSTASRFRNRLGTTNDSAIDRPDVNARVLEEGSRAKEDAEEWARKPGPGAIRGLGGGIARREVAHDAERACSLQPLRDPWSELYEVYREENRYSIAEVEYWLNVQGLLCGPRVRPPLKQVSPDIAAMIHKVPALVPELLPVRSEILVGPSKP